MGLLNIGTEAKKGMPQLREAYMRLDSLNRETTVFVGNVEGKDVFHDDVVVLVCDWFAGIFS